MKTNTFYHKTSVLFFLLLALIYHFRAKMTYDSYVATTTVQWR